jgi:putative glycerol-1-phosphate prenyltransferase
MSNRQIHTILQNAKAANKKLLAVLIDPDKPDMSLLDAQLAAIEEAKVPLIFFGGSLLTHFVLEEKLGYIRKRTSAKIILFPGGVQQISAQADAILFLSLISGRNPELLIGQHVLAAPMIKQSGLETLSTGYMLIDGGRPTTASYISASLPIPADKPDIAACTAMAGEMLGLRHIYMDAGSGAQNAISTQMIATVRKEVDLPIIVGGGIRSKEAAVERANAGADVIVVGNITEKQPNIILEIAAALQAV